MADKLNYTDSSCNNNSKDIEVDIWFGQDNPRNKLPKALEKLSNQLGEITGAYRAMTKQKT